MHHILEWEGRKLGIIGLVEREWLDTGDTALSNTTKYSLSTTPVSSLDRDHLDYTDYADAASMLAEELKKKGEDDVMTLLMMMMVMMMMWQGASTSSP